MELKDNHLTVECPETQSSVITVVGVGGGGGNAVNYVYQQDIHYVSYVVCYTDAQAVAKSPVPVKINLGETENGGDPKIGRKAALDSLGKIREVLDTGTKMVFLTASMGGGTGTGATPVIARIAKELGILTVAIVTMPFHFEGTLRIKQAIEGVNELKAHVDSLIVIDNEKLREIYGDLKLGKCFSKPYNVLNMAVKSVAELITRQGKVNTEFSAVEATLNLLLLKNNNIVVPASVVKNDGSAFFDYYGFTREDGILSDKEKQN